MKTQISALISKAALLLMIIAASVLMPFKVGAATWGDAPIIGININLIGYDYERTATNYTVTLNTSQTRWNCASSSSTMGCQTWISQNTSDVIQNTINGTVAGTYEGRNVQLYEYEIIFDKSYVGYIQTNWSGTDMGYVNNRIYVNGNVTRFTATRLNMEFNITSYNLTYAPEEFINVSKAYNFPIESYTFVNQLYQLGLEIGDSFGDSYYNYPLFSMPSGTTIRSLWSNGQPSNAQVMILGIDQNIYNESSFNQFFSLNNIVVNSFTVISRKDYPTVLGKQFSIFKVEYNISDPNVSNVGTFTSLGDYQVIPIFMDIYNPDSPYHYISTDFALLYGLSNKLLYDINTIANGNAASNQQSQDLSSGTDSMQQQMNSLVGVEDSYNQQFNNSVNSIDFSNPLQQNQGLLGASNFVITVFNGLIANNPFSILIIIVCILLIGKKVIGK